MNATHTIHPLTIVRTAGEQRKAAAAYLEQHHYMRSSGGSGQLFAVLDSAARVNGAVLIGATASTNCDRSIAGACLIGPTASQDAERTIAIYDPNWSGDTTRRFSVDLNLNQWSYELWTGTTWSGSRRLSYIPLNMLFPAYVSLLQTGATTLLASNTVITSGVEGDADLLPPRQRRITCRQVRRTQ